MKKQGLPLAPALAPFPLLHLRRETPLALPPYLSTSSTASQEKENGAQAARELGLALAFNTAVDNHKSNEDMNMKISKILYMEEEQGLALLFEVGLVPFIMTSGCTLGRLGQRSLAPLKRERKRGIKQRDCCTEICESRPHLLPH